MIQVYEGCFLFDRSDRLRFTVMLYAFVTCQKRDFVSKFSEGIEDTTL